MNKSLLLLLMLSIRGIGYSQSIFPQKKIEQVHSEPGYATNMSKQSVMCDYCLYLNTDVSGIDLQKAEYCIEAINTIENTGTAIYFAGTEVLLKEGFESLSGSVNRFYIDDCSAGFEARHAMTQSEQPEVKPTPTSSLQIFPNPANSELNILSETAMRSVRMVSLDGKLVLERQPGADDNKNIRLDVSNLSSGIYILNVETSNGTVTTQKIVRE